MSWAPTGPRVVAPAAVMIDPQPQVHRQSPVTDAANAATSPFYGHPSAQDRAARYRTPYADPRVADGKVAALAQGYPRGPAANPVGYADEVDYGQAPQRIPRLWRDANRDWAGMNVHGDGSVGLVAHVNHWLWLPHLRPAMPTRGYRSVSGVLAGQGVTSSNARVPAVFVPSAVG